MNQIKERRLKELTLSSHPGLHVGDCVPFYFCPRSIMLYLIYRANHPELAYRGGQKPIVHLEADLQQVALVGFERPPRLAPAQMDLSPLSRNAVPLEGRVGLSRG